MKFNYKLSKEIYGLTPWLVDPHSFHSLMAILDNSRNGIELDLPDEKHNSISALQINSKATITDRQFKWGSIPNDENLQAVGIINIDGVITKSGGASSYGMDETARTMIKMSQDSRIIGFIVYSDSGGGSSSAVDIMREAIHEVRQSKPVYGLIQKGGMACSAMYGIIAACEKIYSEDEMAFVGSAGTMIQFSSYPKEAVNQDGLKHRRIYATKSTKKNEAFEEAINNDNYQLMINNVLDPINDKFINNLLSDRPALEGSSYEDGRDLYAKDGIGSFIDGIKPLSEVINEVIEASKVEIKKPKIKSNSKIQNQMTIQELRNDHPELYQSIFDSGVKSERDRVGTWMAHHDTDPEKVKEGIKSGEVITGAEREELLVKASSNKKVKEIESDSPKKVVSKETTDEGDAKSEVDQFYENL